MKQLIVGLMLGLFLSSCVKSPMPAPANSGNSIHTANRRSGDLPPAKISNNGTVITKPRPLK